MKIPRRKFIKTSLTLATVTVGGGAVAFAQKQDIQMLTSRTNNPDLKTIMPSWEGTPLDQDGKYMNHEFPFIHKFGTVFRWMTQKNSQNAFKKSDTWQMPVVKDDGFLNSKDDMIVPFGHATFFVRLNGKQKIGRAHV